MSKFYRNRRNNHPSYEISSNEKKWQNITLTHNPVPNETYIPLDKNPDPKDKRKAYLRKYVANDPIRTRGKILDDYRLSDSDKKKVNQFLREHEENKRVDELNRKRKIDKYKHNRKH